MGRPKKYHTKKARIAAKKAQLKRREKKYKQGRYFRLVIPSLSGFAPTWSHSSLAIQKLRAGAVDLLTLNQRSRGLDGYIVAVERHSGSGLPHLDILVTYSKRVKNSPTRYDYLIKHGDLTRYRTVNKSILEYGSKEDPSPIGNLDVNLTLQKSKVKTELYQMMQSAMMSNPFKFNPIAWLADNKLTSQAIKTNVYKTIRMIKDQQNLQCNRILKSRPGIKEITPELITSTLSDQEYKIFKSWSGYQTIINHINQIPIYGCIRPHKTKNLFLTGPPNTGKSTLAREISKHCASYPLGTRGGWFPYFQSNVYKLLVWDEFDMRAYRYPDLLKLLEGAPMKLPQKGGHVPRDDNQLIITTTNLTLHEHICNRFRSPQNRMHSTANLAVRFTEVIIPKDKLLFLLCKLINSKNNI